MAGLCWPSQSEERLRRLHAARRQLWGLTAPCGPVRNLLSMPDGLRKGDMREDGIREKDKRQVVYYFNPEVLQ